MKKKVIGLSILLLALLLGLSSNCYAYRYPLTSDDIMSVLMTYQGDSNSNSVTFRNNIINDFNYLNNKGYNTIVLALYGSPLAFSIYGFNNDIVTSVSNVNNVNYMSVTINGTMEYFSGGRNGTWYSPSNYGPNTYTNTEVRFGSGAQLNTKYLMYNNDLPGASGPWQSSNIITFVEPHQEINFDMASYGSTQYIDLTFLGDDGLTYNYQDIPIYYKPNDTSEIYLGTFNNPELTTLINDNYAIIYYKNGNWYAKGIQSRDLNIYVDSSPYLSITSGNDLLEYEYSQKSRFSVRDCFYFYSIDNNIEERAIALWYIGSNHTVISGDRIDPSTFNNYDDYDNNINNMLDNIDNIDNIVAGTEPIVDLLTDDEQVSGELAGLISGDANDIANRFGYSPIENPFVDVVVDITESLTDILLGSGDVSLNFGFGGRDYYVSSSKFVLPNNNLTSFIHLCCNAFVLWQLWKYGFKLYEWVNSGRLQNLVNETNGHQYFLF